MLATMTRTNRSPTQKRLAITIVNLPELLKTAFRPGQTVAIVVAVEVEGLSTYEIEASWDREVLELAGAAKREFRVHRSSAIRQKSLWKIRMLRSKRGARGIVQFWVQGDGITQAASLTLRTAGLKKGEVQSEKYKSLSKK